MKNNCGTKEKPLWEGRKRDEKRSVRMNDKKKSPGVEEKKCLLKKKKYFEIDANVIAENLSRKKKIFGTLKWG